MMLTDAGLRSLYVRIILEAVLQLFSNAQCHTQIGTGKVHSVGLSYLTSWDIQKLSSLDLNESTESTSTTALGKLFQILLVNENIS